MHRILGPDTGWDSIGDYSQAKKLSAFLNALDSKDKLAKTIIYNLNPADNEVIVITSYSIHYTKLYDRNRMV